jgi:hypothetical protein
VAIAQHQADSLQTNVTQSTDSLLYKIDHLHDRAREMEALAETGFKTLCQRLNAGKTDPLFTPVTRAVLGFSLLNVS